MIFMFIIGFFKIVGRGSAVRHRFLQNIAHASVYVSVSWICSVRIIRISNFSVVSEWFGLMGVVPSSIVGINCCWLVAVSVESFHRVVARDVTLMTSAW